MPATEKTQRLLIRDLTPEEQGFLDEVRSNKRIGETAAGEAECLIRKSIKYFYNARSDEIRMIQTIAQNHGIALG